jgi:transcription antitermination factor NusG
MLKKALCWIWLQILLSKDRRCLNNFQYSSETLRLLLDSARKRTLRLDNGLKRKPMILRSNLPLRVCPRMNNSLLRQADLNHCIGTSASAVPSDMPRWYAIRTRGRSERTVDAQLRAHGLETFLPLYGEVHRWSDRRREIHRPLFPGYTFLRAAISAEIRSLVLRSAGVAEFVHAMGKPLAIVDREIADVQALAAGQIPFSPCPFVNIGTRVQVRGGALDGLVGILVGRNSDCSLVISVELIQRSVALRVQGYEVVPV